MQRVRMSLPYYTEFGWDAEVVTVDPQYTDISQDDLLMESVPSYIKVHCIRAFSKKWTTKLGFGSISYRSYRAYRKKVNLLLKNEKFDLIYFSTTQFQICTLGAYWKKRFKIPYVIDLQDPWHSEYYQNKPRQQRPPKYWFAYRLNKFLEPIAMKHADGLISVSAEYINEIKARYPQIKHLPEAIITFAAPEQDFEIAARNLAKFTSLLDPGFKNIVYVGRGGMDMYKAIAPVFETIKKGIVEEPELFRKLKLYFIGTSYAPQGQTIPTILPLALQYGLGDKIIEIADRIGYYHTLVTLQQADALFIPGSDDPRYIASKIFPYLLTGKPLLAIFNPESPALGILNEYEVEYAYSYDRTPDIHGKIGDFLKKVINNKIDEPVYNKKAVEKYSARIMAKRQCDLFNLTSC
jgi:glycosyltransferase involved in cell wall biosynthesis